MSSPSDPSERVDLSKAQDPDDERARDADVAFDPYRFGAPDVPPPPEFAPPGYVPPAYGTPQASAPTGGAPPTYPGYPPYPGNQNPGSPYPGSQYPGSQYPGGPYPPAGYAAGPAGNGKAVAGLVLGIASIVLCWTTVFDAVVIVLAVVFSSLGLSAARVRGTGRGQALAGLICAGLGLVLAAVFTVFVVHIANQCGGIDNQDSPGYEQCIRDKI